MKLEFLNKSHLQIKEKYEELKSMCAPKDELIARLENEMMELSGFVEKTMKVKGMLCGGTQSVLAHNK